MTDELPPLWALDMAANKSGWDCWAAVTVRHEFVLDAIIAHARTLAKHETPPVDPAEEQRWKDAREAAAIHFNSAAVITTVPMTTQSIDDALNQTGIVQSAYIALCNRDGVTPNLEGVE